VNCITRLLPDDNAKLRCHLCDTKLKRTKFYHTTLEHLGGSALHVVEAQAKVYKVFNHTREDFDSVLEYNLFVEEREKLVFNLVNGINVQQTKDRIKEHKEKKRALVQQGAPLTNESKLSDSESKSILQKYIIEEYNRVRNRRQKRENLLTSWAHGTLGAEEVITRGNTIEREDERLAARDPQVLLKFTKPGGLASSSSSSSAAMYRPTSLMGARAFGTDSILPDLLDTTAPKTPKSMNSLWNAKLDSLDSDEKTKVQKLAKQAGGYKPTLYSTRCIQEAFSAL